MPLPVDHVEDLPFAPGASPFHIKGVVYRSHVDYVEAHVPGGAAAVNAGFQRPELRAFFEQRFLASTWYDALPIVPLWHITARALRQPSSDFLRARTRHQARGDIHGVYRLILKLASAETVALRLPRVVAQYFDFGTTDVKILRPGVAHMEQAGVPMLLAPWQGIVAETYVQVALEIAGAKNIVFRRQATVHDGVAHGIPVGKLRGEVTFDSRSSEP